LKIVWKDKTERSIIITYLEYLILSILSTLYCVY